MSKISRLLMASTAALAVMAGSAMATPQYQGPTLVDGDATGGSNFQANANNPTTNAIYPEQMRQEVVMLLFLLYYNLHEHGLPFPGVGDAGGADSGIAGGDGMMGGKWSAWASWGRSGQENDFAFTSYDSDSDNYAAGIDWSGNGPWGFGAFVGYTDTDTSSAFNAGGSNSESWSFGPYANFKYNDNWSFDAAVGYIDGEIDNYRAPAGVLITGSQDTETWFGAANANWSKWEGNVGWSGRAGITYSDSETDAYTDSTGAAVAGSDTQFGQVQLAGQISYYIDHPAGFGSLSLLPYTKLQYNLDYTRDDITVPPGTPSPANDDDEFVWSLGTSLFCDSGFNGGLDFSHTLGREDIHAWAFNLRAGYAF